MASPGMLRRTSAPSQAPQPHSPLPAGPPACSSAPRPRSRARLARLWLPRCWGARGAALCSVPAPPHSRTARSRAPASTRRGGTDLFPIPPSTLRALRWGFLGELKNNKGNYNNIKVIIIIKKIKEKEKVDKQVPTKGSHPCSRQRGGESRHARDLGLPRSVRLPPTLQRGLQAPGAPPAVGIAAPAEPRTTPNRSASPCPPAAGQHDPGAGAARASRDGGRRWPAVASGQGRQRRKGRGWTPRGSSPGTLAPRSYFISSPDGQNVSLICSERKRE